MASRKAEDQRQRQRRLLAQWSSVVAGLASAIAISLGAGQLFDLLKLEGPDSGLGKLAADVDALKEQTAFLQREMRALGSDFNAIRDSLQNAPDDLELVSVRNEIRDVGRRLTTLEEAILSNPATALTVPLLRQDLENLKAAYQRDVTDSAKQIDRIYDQNKWFVGLMFSMAIGLIGLAVSNFVQARKRAE